MPSSKQTLNIQVAAYRRSFARPLVAAWGTWSVREGFIVKLTDRNGACGFGEVAPLPAFGTESTGEAGSFLGMAESEIPEDELESVIIKAPPACAFGLWSARQRLIKPGNPSIGISSAALLADRSTETLQNLRERGYSTFKVKVGTAGLKQEQGEILAIMDDLEKGERLRLDPNRGWDQKAFESWIKATESFPDVVEFIEEPFSTDELSNSELLQLAKDSPIPIALDESLVNDGWQWWLDQEWPGYWVVKPSLLGAPVWLDSLGRIPGRVIISSAMETRIGMDSILALSQHFPHTDHGLGTGELFDDSLGTKPGPVLYPGNHEDHIRLWKELQSS